MDEPTDNKSGRSHERNFSRSSTQPVQLLLIGIGGYAKYYLEELQAPPTANLARIRAVVDPLASNSPQWPHLSAQGVPCFKDMDEYLASGILCDLAVVISPIAFHADQACSALNAGMNVLSEKPICATLEDAQRMLAASKASNRFLEIGYQWCYSHAVQKLKAAIIFGKLGSPQKLLALAAWPRNRKYYERNNWAGNIKDSCGNLVYDSPVGNAHAHYLQNMLYLLGDSLENAAVPISVEAECYRVNPITNYDAACCRFHMDNGAELMFFSAHSVKTYCGPLLCFHFEDAVVTLNANNGGELRVKYRNGTIENFGRPDAERLLKLRYCIELCRSGSDLPSICSPQAAMSHTYCVEALQQVAVKTLPKNAISQRTEEDGTLHLFGQGMDEALNAGFRTQKLFAEMEIPWANKPSRIAIMQNAPSSLRQL